LSTSNTKSGGDIPSGGGDNTSTTKQIFPPFIIIIETHHGTYGTPPRYLLVCQDHSPQREEAFLTLPFSSSSSVFCFLLIPFFFFLDDTTLATATLK